MTEMTINVNLCGCAKVEIGVSPQLQQMLLGLLAQKTISELKVERLAATASEEEPTQEPQPSEAEPTQEPPTTVEPLSLEGVTPPAQEDQPQPQPQEEVFDLAAMRKIMEDTRVRLLGPSPENKSHPLYKRLNGQFKTEASMVTGGKCDTPTRLPELGAQFCIAFRRACEDLIIDPETNDISTKLPF